MNHEAPLENKFGFLRAEFDYKYKSKHFDNDLFSYSGPMISHYTDLNGLYGIIESGGFWLSDHRFLNDSEEFENGRKLTKNILERLSKKYRYSNLNEILNETIARIENYCEKAYYICSFSKKGDSLDQWRSYASNGQGISITFDNSKKSLSHFFAMPILSASKVIYDDSEKAKILLRIIRKYQHEYRVDKKHGYDNDTKDWVDSLSTWLAMEFINFKHHEYSSEEEIRLIVATDHLNHFNGVKHRVSKNTIVPYINSKDIYDSSFLEHGGTELLPILEVRVGPAANQELTAKSIEEYLSQKGYMSVKVIQSNVPYRG